MIKVRYESIDGVRRSWSYKTLKAARAKAFYLVGEHAEQGAGYAVSSDGVGKVTVDGCSIAELFEDAAKVYYAIVHQEAFNDWPHMVSGPYESEERVQAEAAFWSAEDFADQRLRIAKCFDEYLEKVQWIAKVEAAPPPFTVIEHHLEPDDFGGERGASRVAKRFETVEEAQAFSDAKNGESERDHDDRSYSVMRWDADLGRLVPLYTPPPAPIHDAFDDMPF